MSGSVRNWPDEALVSSRTGNSSMCWPGPASILRRRAWASACPVGAYWTAAGVSPVNSCCLRPSRHAIGEPRDNLIAIFRHVDEILAMVIAIRRKRVLQQPVEAAPTQASGDLMIGADGIFSTVPLCLSPILRHAEALHAILRQKAGYESAVLRQHAADILKPTSRDFHPQACRPSNRSALP